ncbi:MAG TPA: methylated-DNA--[protein]-cysteine S-methyltransferase [Micromonosporaceae bacterium]|jgi:methylated-DNA-[protein]-cysteine S-methyltransferase|nr:methylated-DNA--[protein]-cysteine S-methyltransferase [Micromonosporaceae bacterium]
MTTKTALNWTVVDSPVGELLLCGDGEALTGVYFSPFERPDGEPDDHDPVLADTRQQLKEYFAGEREEFDLPMAPSGTGFQLRVWAALLEIPYATTTSYGEIARRLELGSRGARAVGLANGSNPIPIIVPCHRVVGADGSLTGYGGGLDRKRTLLAIESPGLF